MNKYAAYLVILLLSHLNAFAGEWPQEEIEREERERKEYEQKSKEFKAKNVEYETLINIFEKKYDAECGEDFFEVSGSIRSLYCHAQTVIAYSDISKLIGAEVFVSGPHTKTRLDLESDVAFGHYNAKFVANLNMKLSSILEDKGFVEFSKPIYTNIFARFESHFISYLILESNPDLKRDLLEGYRSAIENGELKNKHYTQTSKSGKNDYYYFPVSKWAPELLLTYVFYEDEVQQDIYFWLRREMDGTAKEIFDMLDRLITTYNPSLIDEAASVGSRKEFYDLTGNLDRKFGYSELNRLTNNQLRVLRNAILATYGYKFKDHKLKYYFLENEGRFCRNKKCGFAAEYSDSLLTEDDLENIRTIKGIEADRSEKIKGEPQKS